MCELFAINAAVPVYVNDYLDEFYSHSHAHPHGWGLTYRLDEASQPATAPTELERGALIPGSRGVVLWREPKPAFESQLLPTVLSQPIAATHLQAHIRKATCGTLHESNCHPFHETDVMGRDWTLIHNGILFNEGILWGYDDRETGDTDSERVMLFLMDVLEEASLRTGGSLNFEQTFRALTSAITQLGNLNRLNLILDDGTYTYVHTNTDKVTLHFRQLDGQSIIFSTEPLGPTDQRELWKPVPQNRLIAYRNGRLIRASSPHGNVFCEAILEARKALTGSLWDPQADPNTCVA